MDTVGERIRAVAEKIGGLDALVIATSVKRATMFNYASGTTEPKVSALVEISNATGASVNWLATGKGEMLIGDEVQVGEIPLSRVRSVVYNLAISVAGQDLRRMKPDPYAIQFLELFDYLITLEETDDKAAERVVEFASERMRRSSD